MKQTKGLKLVVYPVVLVQFSVSVFLPADFQACFSRLYVKLRTSSNSPQSSLVHVS